MRKLLAAVAAASAALLLSAGASTSVADDDVQLPNCINVADQDIEVCAETLRAAADILLLEHGIRVEGEGSFGAQPSNDATERFAASAARSAGADSPTGEVGTMATYVMTRWYSGIGYTGDTYLHSTSSANPCAQPGSYSYGAKASMPGSGLGAGYNWNDQIESFHGFNHCSLRMYADNNFRGSVFTPTRLSYSDVGAFRNVASSVDIIWVP